MRCATPLSRALLMASAGALLVLAGCASAPPEPPPRPTMAPPIPLTLEKFEITLADGIVLNYQVEQKLSAVNKRACFAYITGVIRNNSRESLSRKTGLDVNVFSAGKQVFRDQTYPVADLKPGVAAAIEMVISPVHNEGCPRYDRIDIALRKVPL